MPESNQICVKCLAAVGFDNRPCRRRQSLEPPRRATTVERIADDRVAETCHMHTELMGASGGRPQIDQGGAGEGREGPVTGQGRLAATGDDGHCLAVSRVAPDVAGDLARRWRRYPPNHRQVGLLDALLGELGGQGAVRGVVLGGHQKAAGVLVQPVDDAGAADPAYARKRAAAMGKQPIDESPIRMARRRMDDET